MKRGADTQGRFFLAIQIFYAASSCPVPAELSLVDVFKIGCFFSGCMPLNNGRLTGLNDRVFTSGLHLGFSKPGSCHKVNYWKRQAFTHDNAAILLNRVGHAPWLKKPCLGNFAHRRQPSPHKNTVWVMIFSLLNGVVHSWQVDARSARLHLQLTPVNTRFVV